MRKKCHVDQNQGFALNTAKKAVYMRKKSHVDLFVKIHKRLNFFAIYSQKSGLHDKKSHVDPLCKNT